MRVRTALFGGLFVGIAFLGGCEHEPPACPALFGDAPAPDDSEVTARDLSAVLGLHWWTVEVPDGPARELHLDLTGPETHEERLLTAMSSWTPGHRLRLSMRPIGSDGERLEVCVLDGATTLRTSIPNVFARLCTVSSTSPIVGDGPLLRGRKGSITLEPKRDEVVLSTRWR